MNSKRLLQIFLLVVLLFAFVRAEDEDSKDVEVAEEEKDVEEPTVAETNDKEPEVEPEEPKPEPKPETKTEKPETKTVQTQKKTTTTVKPQKPTPQPQQSQKVSETKPKPVQPQPNTETKPSTNNEKPNNPNVVPQKSSTPSSSTGNKAAPVANAATTTAAGAAATNTPAANAVVPPVNNAPAPQTVSTTSNVSADNNIEKEEGGNGVVTTTVISLVAVGAVVGVATVGVNAYKKKTNGDNNRGVDMADIEAQPINTDFGNNMSPEDYNPYNIMNDNASAEQYITNNPYEYKPNYEDAVINTTPFQKNEVATDNFMSRESIFSNSGNIPQIGNDVFNFGDNAQLPYVQELPVENSYIEEPVANEIQVENYEMPNSQMPTLVPVQPEIVITQPDEEPAQEGYKQIVPNVAQMEIIETPDFNNMTTSMIEDHINNMDLEQLANTETQPTQNEENDGGYKQIVPDIQEAVIENFDIEDDEEDQDISVVDNITDTYRAALRATYCSTTDDNRFSYRTVDSDHSLLHNMREEGEW